MAVLNWLWVDFSSGTFHPQAFPSSWEVLPALRALVILTLVAWATSVTTLKYLKRAAANFRVVFLPMKPKSQRSRVGNGPWQRSSPDQIDKVRARSKVGNISLRS